MIPPFVIDMHIEPKDGRPFRLWLPFFLLWPLLLVILVLMLVFTILADVALAVTGRRYHHYTMLVLGAFELLGQTRGTSIDITAPDSLVHVVIN